ncbi:unnamed protein product [Haemonchus placei]|uniref:Leishmanolysin-like peptidase n=1 Tax=Haemonchus placei TaxID=6290 RepID=A0A0N4X3I0_HAEPC|nr:unnamed protein product [Haemonchus placei]
MSGSNTQVFALSRVTLALFEDSGWYKVNYDKAEDMEWGKNLGCAFATKSCLTWMKMNPRNPYPFCKKRRSARCSPARLEQRGCNLLLMNKTFPPPPGFLPEYDYNLKNLYHDEKGQPISGYGSSTIADFCPYYMIISHSSRCFSMDAAYKADEYASNLEQLHAVGCFEVCFE